MYVPLSTTSEKADGSYAPTVKPRGIEEPLRSQWRNPNDILSVLMVIGGDIIQKAFAQLSGGYLVPVAFSFGWVAYSFGALMSAVGANKLMPFPDCSTIVINAQSKFTRTNQSWVLGRILRDFEKPIDAALRITVFKAKEGPGNPAIDWVWICGVVTICVQFGIAAIPYVLYENWAILLVTASGTILALTDGAMFQWRSEKWACRRYSKKTISLTRGNGSQHVMVILGNGVGLDLEDLAAARSSPLPYTRTITAVLAILWTIMLITVAGLKENTWYLLAVGFIGMIQNVEAAGAPRTPEAFGIPLEIVETIEDDKVMRALMRAEESFPSVGASLLPIFFPGELRLEEKQWWSAKEKPT